jgi:ParB family chromosome partitioning protein
MKNKIEVNGVDVPIENLVPLQEREIKLKTNKGYKKILSSIKSIGLIEPLCVFKDDGSYILLDGFLRLKACEQLGFPTVPCILYHDKEAYTFNKMVNRLSPYQEHKMLRKSLETIGHKVIEETLGLKSLTYRLGTKVYKELHPDVISVIDKNLMSRNAANELAFVNQQRQLEILKEMKKSNDYSISFARALVIKTPADKQNQHKKRRKTWFEDSDKKRQLVAKLEDVGKRYDFYTNLYRQYTTDLLKVCFYVRKLIANPHIREFLIEKHPDILDRFEKIVFGNEIKKAI